MKYIDIIKAWNAQASENNQWDSVPEAEKIDFAIRLEREACAKICEAQVDTDADWEEAIWNSAVKECARDIRERSKMVRI